MTTTTPNSRTTPNGRTPTGEGTVDAAAQASIGAATRELHLPTVRTEAARLADIALRERRTHLGFLAEVLAAEVDDRTDVAHTLTKLQTRLGVTIADFRHSHDRDTADSASGRGRQPAST
jgi:hypothetical protein